MKKQYVLRTCNADGTSYSGFKWPKRGLVVAPDWDSKSRCGGGLHGLRWGVGDGHHIYWANDALWQVIRVDGEMVDLGGKVKFERGYVVYTGDRAGATAKIRKLGAQGMPVVGNMEIGGDNTTVIGGDNTTAICGNCSKLTAGYGSELTAGDDSTLTAGFCAKLTAGDFSTVTAGNRSTITAGDISTLTAGDDSTLNSGRRSTLTAGNRSTMTAGDISTMIAGGDSTLTAGYGSTLTAGDDSKLTAGYSSTLTAGDRSAVSGGHMSILHLSYCDGRKRIKTAYVGEEGIKPNTPYKLDSNNNFMEVKK